MALRAVSGFGGSSTSILPYSLQDITLTAQAYTLVYGDLSYINNVTTGSSDATITLVSAATAGNGALAVIRKKDAGVGRVFVIGTSSVRLARLPSQGETAAFISDGTMWHRYGWRDYMTNMVAAQWVPPFPGFQAPAAGVPAQKDTLYVHPLRLEEPRWVDQLAVFQQASATNVSVRLALYAPNLSNPAIPDGAALMSETAVTALAGAAGAVSAALGSAQFVRPGEGYWLALKVGNSGTLINMSCINQTITSVTGGASAGEVIGSSTFRKHGYAGVTGSHVYTDSFPATLPASMTAHLAATLPVVSVRIL